MSPRRNHNNNRQTTSKTKPRPKLILPTSKISKDCRLNLPSWIKEQIENNKYRGLKWFDDNKGYFSISWIHASRQGWIEEEDAKPFKDWALYTGVYKPERDEANPKQWKANFRCALNASAAITRVKGYDQLTGKDARRVFKLSKTFGGFVTKRNKGQRLKLNNKLSTKSSNSINIKTEVESDTIPSPTSSTSSSTHQFPTIRNIKSEPMDETDDEENSSIRLPNINKGNLDDIKPTLTLNMKDTRKESPPKTYSTNELRSLYETTRLFPPFQQQLQRFCQMQSMMMNPNQHFTSPYNYPDHETYNTFNNMMNSNGFNMASNNGFEFDSSSSASHLRNTDQLNAMHETLELMLQAANQLEASQSDDGEDEADENDIFRDMRPCSPVSISSSISTEDLEKLLMDPQSSAVVDNDIECYHEKPEQEASSCITTSADPYLTSGASFSEDIRTSLMAQLDI